MFRVRFFMPGDRVTVGPRCFDYAGKAPVSTEAYSIEAVQVKVQAAVLAQLKRDRLVLSHTDDAGFACYVAAPAEPKRKRLPRCCPKCGYVAQGRR